MKKMILGGQGLRGHWWTSWWTSGHCRSCWSGQRLSSTSHLMFSIAMHRENISLNSAPSPAIMTVMSSHAAFMASNRDIWSCALWSYTFQLHSQKIQWLCCGQSTYICSQTYNNTTIQIKLGWALFVTYTIIQSIMRSEMCSLHLTHPSVHTWSSGQPTVQRPGSSRGLPAGAGIRTHNHGLPRVSSPTLYPLGHVLCI